MSSSTIPSVVSPRTARPRISAIRPLWAVEGGRVTIEGEDLTTDGNEPPVVQIGSERARVVHASSRAVSVVVPTGLDGGHLPVRIVGAPGETAFLDVGTPLATGLHQVDSPVIDADGAVYLTYSGTRGERSPVSIFRVRRDGFREPFVTGITNATSLGFSPAGELHVSSRFEGSVYKVGGDGLFEAVARDLGVPCGLAFSPDGTLYVGDRSGTVFRVSTSGRTTAFAALPASVAAFHLAWGPDNALYLTGPTLATYDSVYRIDQTGKVDAICSSFGRPQGLGFDPSGALHVVEALAGVSGVHRVRSDGETTRLLASAGLVGLAFDTSGGLVVASGETAYRLDVGLGASLVA